MKLLVINGLLCRSSCGCFLVLWVNVLRFWLFSLAEIADPGLCKVNIVVPFYMGDYRSGCFSMFCVLNWRPILIQLMYDMDVFGL